MGFRTVYGNTISENKWRMVDEDECNWITVRGTDVTLEIRKGIPTTILGEFAARFNEVIEPLRDADSACWTLTNDVPTSNHLAGTAMDLNWDSHPFHAQGTFGNKFPELRRLLDEEFDGCVWWGGDWEDPIDEMHFQLNFPEGDVHLSKLAEKLVGGIVIQPEIPPADDSALVAALQVKDFSPGLIRLIRAFSIVEGKNPAGNPTLGWTDGQLGGDTSLQGHVDALAKQFIDREKVAGKYPEGTGDQYQAQWIAKVVGQAGVVDWEGNQQPTDYVQRVVNALQKFPIPAEPPEPEPTPIPPQTDHDLIQQIWDQLRIPWPQLGNRTLVDAVAELLKVPAPAPVPIGGDIVPGSLVMTKTLTEANQPTSDIMKELYLFRKFSKELPLELVSAMERLISILENWSQS
jgi:D-alanyl-D-alanine carboxypeptidase